MSFDFLTLERVRELEQRVKDLEIKIKRIKEVRDTDSYEDCADCGAIGDQECKDNCPNK